MSEWKTKIREGREKFAAGLPVCGNCSFWEPILGLIELWKKPPSELDFLLGFCSIRRGLEGFPEGWKACKDFQFKVLNSSRCTCDPTPSVGYKKYFGDSECGCGIQKHHYHCWLCKGIRQIG